MIRFDKVTKRYPDGTEALKDVTVDLPARQLTAIIGPSGCGKTTLMKMVNKLENPTAGAIYIDDEPITGMDEVKLRRSIGYVIQRIGLFPHMTIADNVSLVPKLLNWPADKTDARSKELLQLVGLDPAVFMDRYPLELSGGQQQRVGVVRALAGDPNIVLMDEPFSALDPISREQLQDELRHLQQEIHKTIIFVTHDMDEALKIADTIIVMKDGQVEQVGTPQQLIDEPANEFVRNFIGTERINQKRSFGDRRLKEFAFFFDEDWAGEAERADAKLSVSDAYQLLEQSGKPRLAVVDEGTLVGFAGERELLKAALHVEKEATA
ncbi:betaine/proline/choline family ABC transporter ATP-binding protein [Planococcus sp. CP5-4]|uniref:ABC transporter ATP-binding protein n=1 Tax=unclassified Planococcus (in: firmicutes) TaxID=2662419 RepID=UPI001C238FDD|nr:MULTISPECIES: betaine/proline/choline family ABC transporter ATP-binding protein [unclassified Planococcus (in: firmicutes)]MBU9672350.1 betaine/proline/choline family ABC transporter ATP-binding protein [Planococcus sp. CP5-4_YE]MBV0909401.1 betaine/proline/choline family ABC transporter ATP-binding protein [Planococcus sp. CP5-4_UN]MBW6064130.1 betaine/proline/choline family ABC transporter ATP-binding protein [Planococcus sp. CP5-4]